MEWLRMQMPWFIDEWDSLFWQNVAGFVTGVCVSWFILSRVLRYRRVVKRIRERRNAARASCQLLVERLRTEGLSVPQREKILGLSFRQLQAQLQTGKLKAMEVLRAYQSKAMEMNERLNCVTEPILEAETQAAELDQHTGKKGPLHGIPISVKEAYYIEGYDCTAGLQHFIGIPVKKDAPLVEVLKQQGAIPFVRTNIPQVMLTFDSSNPIYGETYNPNDVTRSPGGSSSGEGALISSGGSCLGIGTDIGGSIRIPSAFCGVCGLKPTVDRLGCAGMFPVGRGETLVRVACGPLGRDVDALATFMKSVLVPGLNEAWPLIKVTPFDTQVYENQRRLRIGYFVDNGAFSPLPAVARGVEMAREALAKRGHTVVKFEPPRVKYMFKDLFMNIVFCDDSTEVNEFLDKDVVDPCNRLSYYIYKIPYFIRYLLSFLVQLLDSDSGKFLRHPSCTVLNYLKLAEDLEDYKLEFLEAMKKQEVDVILSPTFGVTAIPLCTAADVVLASTYTVLYNLLDFPAGTVPVTRVNADDQSKLNDPAIYPAKEYFEKNSKKLCQGSEGLPVNVQCAALPYKEELVLRVMKEIEQEVQYS